MNTVQLNPQMKVADLTRIASEQGCRVRMLKIDRHASCAFTAVSHGHFETALEHIRAASAQLDEIERGQK